MICISFLPSDINIGVYIFSFACYLSMVMTGVTANWANPLTAWYHSKDSEVPMTEDEVSWLVSILGIGGAVSTIPCGILADRFGRKPIILVMGVTSAMCWLLIMTTRSKWTLYLAQVLGGIGSGGVSSLSAIYISEISPPNIRGAIVGQLNTTFFVGQLLVYIAGPQLSYTNYIWLCSSFPIFFIVIFAFAPESPYYLISKGRDEEAKNCMVMLRGKESISELETAQQESLEKPLPIKHSIWKALKTNSHMKHMINLQILSAVSVFNGSVAISVYVVEYLGGDWGAMEMGITFVVASFVAAFLADPIGRRPLLVSSLIGAALFTSVLAAYFIYQDRILLYTGLFGFSFITSVGINPLVMTLSSELFPTSVRAFANGLTQLTINISCFISVKSFVNINETLGIASNFILYTFVSLIGAVAGYLLPETAKSVISTT